MESIEEGIAVPEESAIGKEAEARRRKELINSPVRSDGAMGGTSDAGTAADEAHESANRNTRD